jgi:hypothetical protein
MFYMWGSRGLAPHILNPHTGLSEDIHASPLFSEEAVLSVAPERQTCASDEKRTLKPRSLSEQSDY